VAASQLNELVSTQHRFFETGGTRDPRSRQTELERLRSALIEEQSALEEALRADLGKPAAEFLTGELGFLVAEIGRAILAVPEWSRPKRVSTPLYLFPAMSRIVREPFGSVLVLSPWNAPLLLALLPAIGALAAGNTVVLKPSEHAPCTAQALERLINRRFDRGLLHVVLGDGAVAADLASQAFDHVFFTGGESVGRQVYRAAAERLCPVTLELGGKNPCVVRADAKLQVAARRIVFGKFTNAGQTCIAPDAVFAHASVKSLLLGALKEAVERMFGQNPLESPDYGRIVNAAHFDRLSRMLDGQRVVHGGQLQRDQRFIGPTLVDGVHEDSPLARDEVFGPILPVEGYETDEELDRLLARARTPLALYVFTEDESAAAALARRHPAGALVINDTASQTMNPRLPFGGIGTSGLGSYRGEESFRTFSRPMSVLRRSTRVDPGFRFPPYSVHALGAMRRATRPWTGIEKMRRLVGRVLGRG
jgi:aldehyde dehydrogenase (NAD+)